jgi:hypothetical protein
MIVIDDNFLACEDRSLLRDSFGLQEARDG